MAGVLRTERVEIDRDAEVVTKLVRLESIAGSQTLRVAKETFGFMKTLNMPGFCKYIAYSRMIVNSSTNLFTIRMPLHGVCMNEHIATHTNCIWEEMELVAELDKLIDVLQEAESRGRPHGQVTLDHILVKDLDIWLSNFAVFCGEDPAVRLDDMYLCPSRRAIKAGQKLKDYSSFKADVYSLGICFVTILFNGGEDFREALRDGHGLEIIAGVEDVPEIQRRLVEMLQPEDGNRKTFTELKDFLRLSSN